MKHSRHIFAKILEDQSSKPLIENNLRGVFAEYLVVDLLGSAWSVLSGSWELWDIDGPHGEKIEVKSSAYLQSWCGVNLPSGEYRISEPKFGIKAPIDTAWYGMPPNQRPSDVYVFALHANKDLASTDQRDPSQWVFYVVPTLKLPKEQKTISLNPLNKLSESVKHTELKAEVERVFGSIVLGNRE